jgi:hypothetical protein
VTGIYRRVAGSGGVCVREQLALLENPEFTRTRQVKGVEQQQKIKPWFFDTPDGIVLAPRFGVRALELAPGCTALKVGKADDLKRALEGLGDAANAGELDRTSFFRIDKAMSSLLFVASAGRFTGYDPG